MYKSHSVDKEFAIGSTIYSCNFFKETNNRECCQHDLLYRLLRPIPESYSGSISEIITQDRIAQSAGAVEYTDCTSAEGKSPPLMSVQNMTLNNLMVGFQRCCSFGECRVPLHCHCSQVHPGPEW